MRVYGGLGDITGGKFMAEKKYCRGNKCIISGLAYNNYIWHLLAYVVSPSAKSIQSAIS